MGIWSDRRADGGGGDPPGEYRLWADTGGLRRLVAPMHPWTRRQWNQASRLLRCRRRDGGTAPVHTTAPTGPGDRANRPLALIPEPGGPTIAPRTAAVPSAGSGPTDTGYSSTLDAADSETGHVWSYLFRWPLGLISNWSTPDLGTNLGTKHLETGQNRCDVAQRARRPKAADLYF